MNTIQTTEYAVHLLQRAPNGVTSWRAFVETLPQVTAEGESCEAVLEEIGRKLRATLSNGKSAALAESTAVDLLPHVGIKGVQISSRKSLWCRKGIDISNA